MENFDFKKLNLNFEIMFLVVRIFGKNIFCSSQRDKNIKKVQPPIFICSKVIIKNMIFKKKTLIYEKRQILDFFSAENLSLTMPYQHIKSLKWELPRI